MILRILLLILLFLAALRLLGRLFLRILLRPQTQQSRAQQFHSEKPRRWKPRPGEDRTQVRDAEFKDVDG